MSKPKAKASSKPKAKASSKPKAKASSKTKAKDTLNPDEIPSPKFTLTVDEPKVITAVGGGLSWSVVRASDGRMGIKVNGADDLHKFFGDENVNRQIHFYGASSNYVFSHDAIIPIILQYCKAKFPGKELNIVIFEGVEYHYFPELQHLEIIGTTDYTNCILNNEARNAVYGSVLDALGFGFGNGFEAKFAHMGCFIVWIKKLRTVRIRGAVEYVLGDFLAWIKVSCNHEDGAHIHCFQWDVQLVDFSDSQIKLIDRDCLSGLHEAKSIKLPTSLISLVVPKEGQLSPLLKQYENKWNKVVEGYNPFGGELPKKFFIDLNPNTGCCVIL